MNDEKKNQIIALLRGFVAQRSGIEFANYGTRESFMPDYRRILRDGKQARKLIRAVEQSGISGDELAAAFTKRLALSDDCKRLDYCVGQYFPTEYRAAVCQVCAAALWDYFREDFAKGARGNESAGDAIRRNFRLMFGRAIASRWFN